jgi:hypothetical protein
MKRRNYVAKHAHKFNKPKRMTPEKLKQKQGYYKHKKQETQS